MENLDKINCPQYVRFSSESFQDSLNNGSYSPGSIPLSSTNNSVVEGDLHENESVVEGALYESDTTAASFVSSEEQFRVHTRSQASGVARNLRKKPTVPKPFRFETDNRLKNTNSQLDVDPERKDFTAQLRQHNAPQSSIVSGVTKVKPFNLTEVKKRKIDSEYLSLAEQISAFHKKTPERYHTTAQKGFVPQEHWSPRKLRPRTPNLQAVKRRRVVDVLSRDEQEAKELEEIKAYEFHAKPVDPRVYKPTCISKTVAKQTTKGKDMELKTANRTGTRPKRTPEKIYKFRARPVPKNILAGPTGLKEKPEVVITKPKSPTFTTEKRLEKRKLLELQHEESASPVKKPKLMKKPPPPPPAEPFVPKRTEIQPFSFDKIDKERFAQKEKKIQEEIEKENKPYVFRAQLLPDSAPSTLPQVEKKPTTQPQPFNFNLQVKNPKLNFSMLESSVSFKAQPANVLHKEPFIPEKPPKPIIDVQEFDLLTNKRASERLRQKEEKEIRDLEVEQILLAQRAIEEEKERLEIQKMREEMVHRANPVRQFKQVEVKPSTKPLTKPVTPKFETDKRLQSRC